MYRSLGLARGQAMLEFAVVGPLFVFVLLMMTTIVIYEMERSFMVNSITTATRTAVSSSVGASPTATLTNADLNVIAEQARTTMQHTLLGTTIINLNAPGCSMRGGRPTGFGGGGGFGGSCANLIALQPCLSRGGSVRNFPSSIGTVYVYAKAFPPGTCSANDLNEVVQVVATGDASSILDVVHVTIPITIQATAVRVNYQLGDQ